MNRGSVVTASGQHGQKSRPAAAKPARPQRPRELQDALNHHIYHPLAWRLALLLARTPLTPNMVSVIGAGFVVAAAYSYAQPGWPLPALIGMLLHMSWHVVDGADGDLARITGRASPVGELVDGICAYSSHIVLYIVLGWLLSHPIGPWAWVLMLAAGASHAVQANHVEVQKRCYQWWVYGTPWLRQTRKADSFTGSGISGRLLGGYLALASSTTHGSARVDAAMLATEHDPAARERLRAAARAESPRLMPILKLLGPNPRAPILGLSMIAGSPLYYFLWLVVGLNLVLVLSVRRHDAAADRIIAAARG